MTRYRNELPQPLAVPPEETFDGTWPFEARYTVKTRKASSFGSS